MSIIKKKENQKQNESRQVFKKETISKLVDQMGPYILIGIWSIMNGINVISALGGMTIDEWKQKKIPLTVDFFQISRDGSFVGQDVRIRIPNYVPSRDLESMLTRKLVPDRLLYYRKLNVKYKTVLDINAFGGCMYESDGSASKMGMVMVRVTIEGEECAKGNFAFNGDGVLPMYSSISHTRVLEAGEYGLLVEILYFGCLDNYRSSMELKLTRHGDVTYGEYDAVREKEFRPVRNGKITIENTLSTGVNRETESIAKVTFPERPVQPGAGQFKRSYIFMPGSQRYLLLNLSNQIILILLIKWLYRREFHMLYYHSR